MYTGPAHGYPRTDGRDGLTTLGRVLTEQTVTDGRVTVLVDTLPCITRFTVGLEERDEARTTGILPKNERERKTLRHRLLSHLPYPFHCWLRFILPSLTTMGL